MKSSNQLLEKNQNKGKFNTALQLTDFLVPKNEPNLELVKLVAELTSNNKSRRLDPNTKKFSGSVSEDIDEWLFNIEQGFISSKIKDEEKLNAVVNFVEKVPAQILRKHILSFSSSKLFEATLKTKTANGSVSYISGVTKPLEIDISGNKCLIEFLVFDHDDHDVLFGLDWSIKMGCGIFPSQGLLEFKNDIRQADENNLGNDKENIFQTDVGLSIDYYWDISYNDMLPASELNPKM
ncbi:unnamed protein product [Brachionus calyciflorus]|uniref:Uncharacterized protein n=1 Tax=Brachionus calyciflorus TaxID=104777 RepID=A0A814LEG9_9BILA|nr:unnamed protein product [Brachionus calyciflorus]